ncbi:MAG TPA: AraC family transcriptional regulator [Candidatus Polarisedimenticolia bacterium]|jgi:AraC-like DNA-binding protein|nr:AraC family transcriptional regulator [Candidatus Polarisedimenticolia bacterium]
MKEAERLDPEIAGLPVPAGGSSRTWPAGRQWPLSLMRATYVRQSFPPHFHETFVIALNERGAHELLCGGERYLLSRADVGIIPPGVRKAALLALYPETALMMSLARDLGFPGAVIHDPWLASKLVHVHPRSGATADGAEQDELIRDALGSLISRHAEASPLDPSSNQESEAVGRARSYLEAHHAEAIHLEDLARIARMSPFHLLRQFHRHLGLPPHAYLVQVRVGQARELLAQELPPGRVAQEAGFTDQSHMNRCFKRIVGVTPGCYAGGMSRTKKARTSKTLHGPKNRIREH